MNTQENKSKELVNPFAPMEQSKYFGIMDGWNKLMRKVSQRRGKRKYWM